MAGQPGAYGGGTGARPKSRRPSLPQPGWPSWMPKPNSTRPGGRFGPVVTPSLPSGARVISDYPARVPTGVGGGNAGASTAQPLRSPGGQPRSSGGGFNYQPPAPAAPGLSNVVRPVTGRGGRERAYTAMVQQAGLSPQALQLTRDAAEDAGKIANQQRLLQGGKGYLSSESLDPKLDPSKQEYWDRADIKAWAAVPSHKAMVDALQKKHGYTPVSPVDRVIRSYMDQSSELADVPEGAFYGEGTPGFMPNVKLEGVFDPLKTPYPKAFESTQQPYWGAEVEAMNNAFTGAPGGPKRFDPGVGFGIRLEPRATVYPGAFQGGGDESWGPETIAGASILGDHLDRIKAGADQEEDPEELPKKLGPRMWNTKLNYRFQ